MLGLGERVGIAPPNVPNGNQKKKKKISRTKKISNPPPPPLMRDFFRNLSPMTERKSFFEKQTTKQKHWREFWFLFLFFSPLHILALVGESGRGLEGWRWFSRGFWPGEGGGGADSGFRRRKH